MAKRIPEKREYALAAILLIAFIGSSFLQKPPSPVVTPAASAPVIASPEETLQKSAPAHPAQEPAPGEDTAESAAKSAAKSATDKIEELRSVAKQNLSSIYAAEKAFFAENERYTTDLKALGFTPSDQQMQFKMGFLRESKFSAYVSGYTDNGEINEDPRRMDTDSIESEVYLEPDRLYSYSPEAQTLRLGQFEKFCEEGCSADENGFEVLLAVPLDEKHVDVWRINSRKEIVRVQDGLQDQ